MGKGKLWNLSPLSPSTNRHQICTGDYVVDIYHPAKFYPDRIRGFASMHARLRGPLLTRLFLGSIHHLQPRHHHGHWSKISHKTWFRARMCLFGVAKPKFNIYTPFPPKPPFWGQWYPTEDVKTQERIPGGSWWRGWPCDMPCMTTDQGHEVKGHVTYQQQ